MLKRKLKTALGIEVPWYEKNKIKDGLKTAAETFKHITGQAQTVKLLWMKEVNNEELSCKEEVN